MFEIKKLNECIFLLLFLPFEKEEKEMNEFNRARVNEFFLRILNLITGSFQLEIFPNLLFSSNLFSIHWDRVISNICTPWMLSTDHSSKTYPKSHRNNNFLNQYELTMPKMWLFVQYLCVFLLFNVTQKKTLFADLFVFFFIRTGAAKTACFIIFFLLNCWIISCLKFGHYIECN